MLNAAKWYTLFSAVIGVAKSIEFTCNFLLAKKFKELSNVKPAV